MTKILYLLFIKPISLLPFRALYILSDFLYLILYKVIGYRTKVVRQNLTSSFTDLSKEEIKDIESKFYHHLCDIICESLKVFNVKEEDLFERCVYNDLDLINKYKDRNLCILGGHYNNWEYAGTVSSKYANREIGALYTKLSNQFFNSRITRSRERFGLKMIDKNLAKEYFNSENNKPIGIIFGADQSPTYSKNVVWADFLGQDTALYFGPEKYSRENDMVVIYTQIIKKKRGFYECNFKLISDDVSKTEHGEILEKYTRLLEKDIKNEPQYWLWTHKRWKREKKEGEELLKSTVL
ncbi:acetyltransferase [Flammeovirga pectinis]|uniref:Acetyltransferase n=1 Tax=Flammeovirga pectinis TaxID=2494373 RepID=A0A3Q9FP41_9BACT|nr:lysophospholipid acyltransferase family protein [Flammeovirga pectinis]AZQ61626.1 acetyltransferase [Flammeovirga pectinis]